MAMDIGLNGLRKVMNWGGWTRTTNFLINSQAICQLIYAPSVWHFRSFFPPIHSDARRSRTWRALLSFV